MSTGPSSNEKEMPRTIPRFLGYLLQEIVRQRRWLLIPAWMILAIVAAFLFLIGGSSLLPAIYLAF